MAYPPLRIHGAMSITETFTKRNLMLALGISAYMSLLVMFSIQ
jgi:hypothetical protein